MVMGLVTDQIENVERQDHAIPEETIEIGVADSDYLKDQVKNYIKLAREVRRELNVGYDTSTDAILKIAKMIQMQNIYDPG